MNKRPLHWRLNIDWLFFDGSEQEWSKCQKLIGENRTYKFTKLRWIDILLSSMSNKWFDYLTNTHWIQWNDDLSQLCKPIGLTAIFSIHFLHLDYSCSEPSTCTTRFDVSPTFAHAIMLLHFSLFRKIRLNCDSWMHVWDKHEASCMRLFLDFFWYEHKTTMWFLLPFAKTESISKFLWRIGCIKRLSGITEAEHGPDYCQYGWTAVSAIALSLLAAERKGYPILMQNLPVFLFSYFVHSNRR